MRVAIVAALEREIQPLVRGWRKVEFTSGGKRFSCYRKDDLLALAGGIGCGPAQRAARAVAFEFRPRTLVSAGLAGALIRSLKAGNVIVPNVIVDAGSGAEYRCGPGEGIVGGGILVTAGAVAGSRSKRELVEKFHALAVDMEAAAVAEVAREEKIGFRCVKAISDETEFPMPPMDRFVGAEGNFDSARFARWAGVRPLMWPAVIALARNSRRAAQSLCDWLREKAVQGLHPAPVTRIDRSDLPDIRN